MMPKLLRESTTFLLNHQFKRQDQSFLIHFSQCNLTQKKHACVVTRLAPEGSSNRADQVIVNAAQNLPKSTQNRT